MAIIRKAEPVGEEDGVAVIDLAATEDSDDWMRAGRLRAAAAGGDGAAAAEYERMQHTPMAVIDDKGEGP